MSDIKCAICREPWDSYSLRDGTMTTDEVRHFRKGDGCPCCNFGTMCENCRGSGYKTSEKYDEDYCELCFGSRKLAGLRSLGNAHLKFSKEFNEGKPIAIIHYGITPEYVVLNTQCIGTLELDKEGIVDTIDGKIEKKWYLCPCTEHVRKCATCNGSGKRVLTEKEKGNSELYSVASELGDDDADLELADSFCDSDFED